MMLESFASKNNGYKIEMDEFCTLAFAHKKLVEEDRLDKVFDMIDQNQDGVISQEKFTMLFSDKAR